MRCYIIALSVVAIMTELQITAFIRNSVILHTWITRGLFYGLIGIMALEELDHETDKNMDAPGREECMTFIHIMAYATVGIGLLYYAMGCLCMQVVRNKVYADYEKRCQELRIVQQKAPAFAPPTDPVL